MKTVLPVKPKRRPVFKIGDIVHGSNDGDKARVTATCEGRIVGLEYLSDGRNMTVHDDRKFAKA